MMLKYLELDEDKCKLIILSKKENNSTLSLGNEAITSSGSEKLLGITIDHKLTFNEHVENLCIKANKKLHALSRMSNYMSRDKLRIIMKFTDLSNRAFQNKTELKSRNYEFYIYPKKYILLSKKKDRACNKCPKISSL